MPATKLILLAALLSIAGCKPPTSRTYTAGQKSGHPTITIGAATVLFEGSDIAQGDNLDVTRGTVITSGSAITSGGMTINGADIKYAYSNNVLRFTVGGQSFDVIENGEAFKFADRTFSTSKPQTILLRKDGTTQLQN